MVVLLGTIVKSDIYENDYLLFYCNYVKNSIWYFIAINGTYLKYG